MKWFLVFFVFLFLNLSLFSQDRDSLRTQLYSDIHDTLKLETYRVLSMDFRKENLDSAHFYAQEGMRFAEVNGLRLGVAKMENVLGTLHYQWAQLDSAKGYYQSAYLKAVNLEDSFLQAALLNNLGMLFLQQTQYDTALITLFKAREIREKIDDPKITSTINNIGVVYDKLYDLENALKYYQKATSLKEQQGLRLSLSHSYLNMGTIYSKLERYDSAIMFCKKSLDLAEEFKDKNKQARAHNNLAMLYAKEKETFPLAEYHYGEAIEIKVEMKSKVGLINSYNNYASFLLEKNEPNRAWSYMMKLEKLAQETGKSMHTYKTLLCKASILKELGRYEEALEVQRSALDMRYDETSKEKNDKIAELEVAYETARKEAEIGRLSLENELKTANLARVRNEKLIIAITAILLLTLIVVFFTLKHKKERAEREAQELQLEAMQKRFMELHSSPAELAVKLDFNELNQKLNTPLTDREFETLKLSIEGKTNTEISESLFISVSTVKFHLRNTYSKMGVGNRKEAFQYMLKTS